MEYVSTRGRDEGVSFDEAVVRGQAPDGGLYVPTHIPPHPLKEDRDVRSLAELAVRFLGGWTGRTVDDHLARDVFSFPIPVVDLGEMSSAYAGIHVVELFHGPTESFKDFGARFLARWMAASRSDPSRVRVVLVATSGDTGSAVADGFSGQEGTVVVVLYPSKGVSPYQREQLTRQRAGVYPLAVRGSFDDCQQAVKEAFRDPSLRHMELTSANSINIGRLVPQMLFYAWSALRVDCADPIFIVPSGNLGNLCAGMMAAASGIPDATFLAATNHNRFLIDYLADSKATPAPVKPSLSNAMDVAVPSNLERIVHLFGGKELNARLTGASVSDADTRDTMTKVWSETGYVADPHTAVGIRAALRSARSERPRLVMGTASPRKYADLVRQATGQDIDDSTPVASQPKEVEIDKGLPALRRALDQIAELA